MLEDGGLDICWDTMVDQLEEAESLACLSGLEHKMLLGDMISPVESCRLVRCLSGMSGYCRGVSRPKSMIGGSSILKYPSVKVRKSERRGVLSSI